MARSEYHLRKHLERLALGYRIGIGRDNASILLQDFLLPRGYNAHQCSVLLVIPPTYNYPVNPPGVTASRLYLPPSIRYQGRILADFHFDKNPGWGDWAWFCFERIDWNASDGDDLVVFFDAVRMCLSDPQVL